MATHPSAQTFVYTCARRAAIPVKCTTGTHQDWVQKSFCAATSLAQFLTYNETPYDLLPLCFQYTAKYFTSVIYLTVPTSYVL